MATSNEFITEMARFYVDALRSGLPYNFAYDISLTNAARTYQFSCAPLTQELKLNLLINPNGCTNTVEVQSGLGGYQGSGNLPVEISKMITIMGIDAAQQRLTELFVSCLDGTLVNNGFDETIINSIIQKFLVYIQKGCLTTRLLCDCNSSSKDPCRVVTSISNGRNVRYDTGPNFAEIDEQLTNKVQNLLSNNSGTNFEIENLTVGEINQIEQTFIDVLNILYSNNRISTDPNSGEPAAIIRDFFDQARQFDRTTRTRGFSGSDFVVLLSLLNSNGQFPRLASLYSRIVNQVGNILKPLANVRVQPGSFEVRPDYSSNSVLFSSVLQFETKNVDCNPDDYPYLGDDSKIQQTCECPPPQSPTTCRTSFLANVVPNPIIYEVPFFYASGKAVAELPTPPDVQFIPYKDVDSSVLINLNTMAGRYTTKFVPITGQDEEYINSLASSRGVTADSLFDFEGDPDVQYYEAFRIDKHPTTYQDFQQGSVFKFVNYREGLNRNRNVSVFRDIDIKAYSNGISQQHNIVPNKKYYYIFRTIDINNNISNPSKVFELEMINNGGAIFPVIRVVDFAKPSAITEKAEMRRLFMMSPTRQQTDIYSSTLELVENYGVRTAREAIRSLKLATNVENPIWDKKFKIRFTSLDTGRMLDINVVPTIEIIDPVEKCGPGTTNTDSIGQVLDTFYSQVTTGMNTPI
jgi:hypothetical protein